MYSALTIHSQTDEEMVTELPIIIEWSVNRDTKSAKQNCSQVAMLFFDTPILQVSEPLQSFLESWYQSIVSVAY